MKLGSIAAATVLVSVESLVETSTDPAVVEQETRQLGDAPADPWSDDGHPPPTDDAWKPPLPPLPPLPPRPPSSTSEDYYYYSKGGKSGSKGGKSGGGGGKGGKSNAYGYYYYDDDDDDDHGPWYPPYYPPRPQPHRPHPRPPVSRDDDWGYSGCSGRNCEGEHNHYHGHWINLPRPAPSSPSSPSAKGGKTKGGKSGSKGGKSGSKGGKSNAYGYYYYDDDDDDDHRGHGGYGYLGGYYGPGYGPGYYPGGHHGGRGDDDWSYPGYYPGYGHRDDDWAYASPYPIRPSGPGYWVGGYSQPAYVPRPPIPESQARPRVAKLRVARQHKGNGSPPKSPIIICRLYVIGSIVV